MKFIVRLKLKRGSEEYYFNEYKAAWEFMLRCNELDIDFIRVPAVSWTIRFKCCRS